MKAVLISIKPTGVEKIAQGKKTFEVRKTKPKIDVPFKCYIYETKAQFIKSVKGACTSYGYGRGKSSASSCAIVLMNIHSAILKRNTE